MKKWSIWRLISTWLSARKQRHEMARLKESFTVHEERNGLDVTLTLIRIIKEGSITLDETSVKMAKKIYLYSFALSKKLCGCKVTFSEKIREMTMDEIAHAQKCWNDHAESQVY